MAECKHVWVCAADGEGGKVVARCELCGAVDPNNILAGIVEAGVSGQERIADLQQQLAAANAARLQAAAEAATYRMELQYLFDGLKKLPLDRLPEPGMIVSHLCTQLALWLGTEEISEPDGKPHPGAALLDLLRQAGKKGPEAREMFRRYGIVFDRWPVVEHLGAWTPEAVAALDVEIRWQGIAFSLYTDLAEMESAIDALGLDTQAEGKSDAEQ